MSQLLVSGLQYGSPTILYNFNTENIMMSRKVGDWYIELPNGSAFATTPGEVRIYNDGYFTSLEILPFSFTDPVFSAITFQQGLMYGFVFILDPEQSILLPNTIFAPSASLIVDTTPHFFPTTLSWSADQPNKLILYVTMLSTIVNPSAAAFAPPLTFYIV